MRDMHNNITDEFRSVRNDIALNKSAIKSVKKWISVESQIRDFHQVLYCRYRNFTIEF